MVGIAATTFPITVFSASLPEVAADFNTNESVISWVLAAPLLAMAIASPIAGKLGDYRGHRLVYIVGFALAIIFSFLTAASWNIGSLITFRTIGQAAGAVTGPATVAILLTIFPSNTQSKALGYWGTVTAVSPAIGVAVGGPLIEWVGWRSVFVIEGFIAFAAFIFAIFIIPETRRKPKSTIDYMGAVLLVVAVVALMFSISRGIGWSFAHPGRITLLASSLLFFYLFIKKERKAIDPFLPLSMFLKRNFTAPVLVSFFMNCSYLGAFAITPFLLERIFEYGITQRALVLIIRPLMFALGAAIGGTWHERFGARQIVLWGTVLVATSAIYMGISGSTELLVLVFLGLVCSGMGHGVIRPSLITVLGNTVRKDDLGLAAGAFNTVGLIGASIGITMMIGLIGNTTSGISFLYVYLVAFGIAVFGVLSSFWISKKKLIGSFVIACSTLKLNGLKKMPPKKSNKPKQLKIERALISVYDKTGVVDFAKGLSQLGIEIVSSGGTAKELMKNGVEVIEVSEVTGFSEVMDGRLKTLHPKVFGGILADLGKKSHQKDLEELGAKPIGLVVCNLYPFLSDPSIELIDIGGPSMVRAAAKNHEFVGVVVAPSDYETTLQEISKQGYLSLGTKKSLAKKAFTLTAQYDIEISKWLDDSLSDKNTDIAMGVNMELRLERTEELRYGENPHLKGALYKILGKKSFWDEATQLNGKPLSYLNIYDTTAAWQLANNLMSLSSKNSTSAVIVKHANPCGAAMAENSTQAFALALECDSISAFGGIVAIPDTINSQLAKQLTELFLEVIIATDFDSDALETLTQKKNLRLLKAPAPVESDIHIRSVENRILVQSVSDPKKEYEVVTTRQPTENEWADLIFAQKVVGATTSNAIVIAKDQTAWGIGAGQQNRKDASQLAFQKAAGRAIGGVCASDAFFPFPDGLDGAISAGCVTIIQPGGSVNDSQVIEAAEAAGLAMVFTGVRQFRH